MILIVTLLVLVVCPLLLALLGVFACNRPAEAFSWADLWQRADQQARHHAQGMAAVKWPCMSAGPATDLAGPRSRSGHR